MEPTEPNPSNQPLFPANNVSQPSPQQDPPQPQNPPYSPPSPEHYQPSSGTFAPQPSQPNQSQVTGHISPNVIVLQWLTYAFWGWTVLAMALLTGAVLANFIASSETGGVAPYAIASVLVLLPISIVCDVLYSKHEPQKKTGAASVVLVIHAVLFALFGIGAVIGIVLSLVTLFTSSSATDSNQVSLYTFMIVSILYAAVLLRTLNPPRFPWVRRFFIIFMAVVVGLISILGIVGPVANERTTKDDKLIEQNLSSIKLDVDTYASQNKKLPDSLSSINLAGDAKKAVDANLVKYTPNTKQASVTTVTPTYTTTNSTYSSTIYYYELCANYKKASKSQYASYGTGTSTDSDGYSTYLTAYYHPAG